MADDTKSKLGLEVEKAGGVTGRENEDKTPESIERANITPVDQGCGVAEKDKKL